jgi:hypothetical protein
MLVRRLILGASALALGGCGITGNFRHDPGYADFGSLTRLEADSDFGLSLGPLPLQIAKWVSKDDEDLDPLLRDLRAVRVYTLEGLADAEDVAAGVDELTAELARDGWLHVIALREECELTSVYLRPSGDFTHRGLTVIVQEPDEVVLVNLIGNINLDFINGYMAEVDVEMPPIEIDPATLQARLLTDPASPVAGIDP